MATVSASTGSSLPNTGNLSTAQTGTGASANIVDSGSSANPGLLRITTTVGATPTVTVAIEGSEDANVWYPIPYADTPTPTTTSVATFVITTAGTIHKHLLPNYAWRYVRLNYSANTNVTLTADVWIH